MKKNEINQPELTNFFIFCPTHMVFDVRTADLPLWLIYTQIMGIC